MSFAILRTKKLKEWGNISASLQHNFRERKTLNADINRTQFNIHLGGTTSEQVMNSIKSGLPEKYRADCVKCVEYLITASPEWFRENPDETQKCYFHQAIEWLKDRHGAENIKYIGIQYDESTPHLVAYVVPIDERGKLNCKNFLGGRKKMAEMQSSFADRVSKFGLKRGIEGSKSTHQRVKRFYGNIEQNKPSLTLDDIEQKCVKKGVFHDTYEPLEDVKERIAGKVQAILDHRTAEINSLKKKLEESERINRELNKKLSKIALERQREQRQEKLRLQGENRSMDDLGRSRGVGFGR